MGRPPMRIDIMMSIPGIKFEEAWSHRIETKICDLLVPFISREDLIRAKRAAARPQDLMDADSLEKNIG